jgi:hypothetical protein
MRLGHFAYRVTHNLDARSARPQLFDTHRRAGDASIGQDDRGNPFGKHLDERDVLLRDDHPDGDQADILRQRTFCGRLDTDALIPADARGLTPAPRPSARSIIDCWRRAATHLIRARMTPKPIASSYGFRPADPHRRLRQ